MRMKKTYDLFEGLRIAMLTTFISGFINAYTYNTQGNVFAGAQTGNVLGIVIYLIKGKYELALSYFLPIIPFIIGQFAAYFGRLRVKNDQNWPLIVVKIMALLILITALLAPSSSSYLVIILLAFVSSLQLDAFPRVRGTIYANTMMTGNVKNAAAFWIKGIVEKDIEIRKQSYYTMIVLLCFMLGVAIDTIMVPFLSEYSLYFLIFPILLLYYFLNHQKTLR